MLLQITFSLILLQIVHILVTEIKSVWSLIRFI